MQSREISFHCNRYVSTTRERKNLKFWAPIGLTSSGLRIWKLFLRGESLQGFQRNMKGFYSRGSQAIPRLISTGVTSQYGGGSRLDSAGATRLREQGFPGFYLQGNASFFDGVAPLNTTLPLLPHIPPHLLTRVRHR